MLYVFVLITIAAGVVEEVLEDLKKIEEVEEAYGVYGVYDIIAEVKTDSMAALNEVMINRVRQVNGIAFTSTLIVD